MHARRMYADTCAKQVQTRMPRRHLTGRLDTGATHLQTSASQKSSNEFSMYSWRIADCIAYGVTYAGIAALPRHLKWKPSISDSDAHRTITKDLARFPALSSALPPGDIGLRKRQGSTKEENGARTLQKGPAINQPISSLARSQGTSNESTNQVGSKIAACSPRETRGPRPLPRLHPARSPPPRSPRPPQRCPGSLPAHRRPRASAPGCTSSSLSSTSASRAPL